MLSSGSRSWRDAIGGYSPIQTKGPTFIVDHDRLSHAPVKPRSPPDARETVAKPR